MPDGEPPRRRDILRAGAAAGLAGLGLAASGVSALDGTVTQNDGGESSYAFSYGLQTGDRFQVQSPLRTPEGDPATESVPASCRDAGDPSELRVLIVRAYRGDIDLGYEGLLVPPEAIAATGETTTTPETTAVNDTAETTTTPETAVGETTAGPETATEAALQDATTTEKTSETTTAGDTESATDTEPTPLPEIRLGEWYRVDSVTKCDSVSKMTVAVAEPPETATADP
ncbi:hypothetical protein [Halorussus marinus]|uniref:hypothetical protein n=1 Tax=Halorussus marinus TaxID=2505976 RepID=UPI00106E58AA|nr:hypothetical protein [Halorussus marinus]